ncbi:hypothetical protein [Sphingomonas sp. Root241]|uniref:hypothetical protein n=1 Tax=Sphingomonas sp. Root241 TaxID=1736501 RepID=UPI0006F6C8E2|nr:hypothetical protein [Sphingomonas sp. Root241]KRC79090.1 hypothetical protein ASE13_16835 [Sphingomonas sp. Root241]
MRPSPLLFGIGAGLIGLLALSPFTGAALGDLAVERAQHARIVQAAALPARQAPILARGSALDAMDAAAGRAAMMARIQRLAKAGGVLVEETSAADAPEGLVALRVRASGAEKAVLALADAFERERPVMRFRSWTLEPIAGGVRLTAEAVAAR